jgi:hypothetical protein
MRQKYRLSLFALAATMAALMPCSGIAQTPDTNTALTGQAFYAPQVGQLHDDFVLPDIDDRGAVALSQFRGKKVLLIHFASW